MKIVEWLTRKSRPVGEPTPATALTSPVTQRRDLRQGYEQDTLDLQVLAFLEPRKGEVKDPRFESVLARARQRYPDSVGSALIQGLAPLARIAFTARLARRTLRWVTFQVESARNMVEGCVRAAEKAAGGLPLDPEEVFAAQDKAMLRATELEERHGNQGAAHAALVARLTARCVGGFEPAFGENVWLADYHFQRAVEQAARERGQAADQIKVTVHEELCRREADLERLILYAEATKDAWLVPNLGEPLETRNDRGWRRMLQSAPRGRRDGGEFWKHIHETIKDAGGSFYPPDLFEALPAAKDLKP